MSASASLRSSSCALAVTPPGAIERQARSGVRAMRGSDDRYRVDVDRRIVRARLEPQVQIDRTETAADGDDVAPLTDIPAHGVVRIDGRPAEHDGTLELIATRPGEHHGEITRPRHLIWQTSIRAA